MGILHSIFGNNKQHQKKTHTSGNLEFLLQSTKWDESEQVKDFSCKLTSWLLPAKLLEMDLF